MCRVTGSTKNISPRRIKAKNRIRLKSLGNSHGLGRAMHTREKRTIRPREAAPTRDAESGGTLPLPSEGGTGKEKAICCSQSESGEAGRRVRDSLLGRMNKVAERESNASTSCSQPPALGGDTHQLSEISFTFTHKHRSSSCPGIVTAKGVHAASETTLHPTHRAALHPGALLWAMYPGKRPLFPDVSVWKPAAGRAQ